MNNEDLEQFEYALSILERIWGKQKDKNTRIPELKIINIADNLNFNKKEKQKNNVVQISQKEQKVKLNGITIFRKQGCKTWYTRYRKNGKQHYVSGKTQKDVYNKIKEIFNKQNKEKALNELTYSEWQSIWLEKYKSKNKDTTLKSYKSLEKKLSKSFKNKKIKNILEIDIIQELENINANRQKQKMYEYLKDIFSKAKSNNIINKNIIETIEKPKYNRNTRQNILKSEEEIIEKFCFSKITNNEYEKKYSIFYLLMLYQGLRPGECLALKPKCFDLKNKILHITESLNANSKDTNTKNKQSVRTIPIFIKTLNLLNLSNILNDYKENEYIFKFKNNAMNEHFTNMLNELKIKKYVPYELRHTFITRCKEKNIPEHIIQTWVGHEIGSKVTSQVYTHFDKTTEIEYINILNNTK